MTKLKVVEQVEQLPSIHVDGPFVDIEKTLDPAKVAEQLHHANQQLELTRHYPGRERSFTSRK
jgi:hypothetical protein